MKQTIYKYNLKTANSQELDIPPNAQILAVQTQYNEPKLWVLLNPEDLKTIKSYRTFETYGTGNPFNPTNDNKTRNYIGTYQVNEGSWVFHVFEVID